MFESSLPYYPLSTNDFTKGLYRRVREKAIKFREIQVNTHEHKSYMVFDIDHTDSVYRWHDLNLPAPTYIVTNPKTMHSHYLYHLKNPVFNTVKRHQIRYYNAIRNAFNRKLGGDLNYNNTVTHNPLHSDWIVLHHDISYELNDLAEWIDLSDDKEHSYTRNTSDNSHLGRNCFIFERLRRYAMALKKHFIKTYDEDGFNEDVRDYAERLNMKLEDELDGREISYIATSVIGWVWNVFEGYNRMSQSERGKKGGIARWNKYEDLHIQAKELRKEGLSYQQIADRIGKSKASVIRWVNDIRRTGLSVPNPSQRKYQGFIAPTFPKPNRPQEICKYTGLPIIPPISLYECRRLVRLWKEQQVPDG